MRLAAVFAVLPVILLLVLFLIREKGRVSSDSVPDAQPGLELLGNGYRIIDDSHRTHDYDGSNFGAHLVNRGQSPTALPSPIHHPPPFT